MAVKIRLALVGKRNKPAYRIVVIDSAKPRSGKCTELLGFYNPSEQPIKLEFNKNRYDYWLSVGAQPTPSVVELINGEYVFKPYKTKVDKKEGKETKAEITKQEKESDTASIETNEPTATKENPTAEITKKDVETTSEKV